MSTYPKWHELPRWRRVALILMGVGAAAAIAWGVTHATRDLANMTAAEKSSFLQDLLAAPRR